MSIYNEVLSRALSLTPNEQLRLLELATYLRGQVTLNHQDTSKELPKQQLDKWRGFLPKRVDPLAFQLELRREWDDRGVRVPLTE